MSTFDPPSALSTQNPIPTSSTAQPVQEETPQRVPDLPLPVASTVEKVVDQTGERVRVAFQEFLLR
jgi:hypothetical protein